MDEFAVYRGVLSQAEIVDHYNNGAGKYYASSAETTPLAQAPASDFKPVSYKLPNTTNLGPQDSLLQQTTTIASFTYDGDGRQVKAVVGSTTTYYVGAHYQVDNGVVTKYYFAGAQRVAMRKNGTLYYLLSDHLGSTSITTDTSGNKLSELRYKAWGETRYSSGTTFTNYRYTGQREEPSFGLYFYNARWYDPLIGRFAQADTIVPEQSQGVQAWDRYAYVNNSPVKYIDPNGHKMIDIDQGGGGYYCNPNKLSDCGGNPGSGNSILDKISSMRNKGFVFDRSANQPTRWDIESDLETCSGNTECINLMISMYYEDFGHPLDELVLDPPIRNPLGKNGLGFTEPAILMEMQNGVNTRFLKELDLDFGYAYNYEPTYLSALKDEYPKELEAAVNVTNSIVDSVPGLNEFLSDHENGYPSIVVQTEKWMKAIQEKYPVGGDR